MAQLAFAGRQPATDLTQRLGTLQMAKQHGTNWPQQLKPRAWRSARCSITARSNSARESNCNIWLKMLDTRITVVVVLPMVHVFSTQTVAEFYRRRSNANLDKSDHLSI